ncbi:MAG TPA: M24 family metallopeptidase [Acidimicrobiales bacterium]|jgi:Xaa-Pro aminopeptidase|nr:M24 family metallopeptidase [Acidimicrobiales bacterium]
MTVVTNDYRTVLEHTGFDAWYHSLPPKLGIDQFRSVLPTMVATPGGAATIVAKEIDRTNLEALAGGADFVFHTPYFTFDRVESPSDAAPDLPSAVAVLTDGRAELDPRMSVSLYEELAARMPGSARMQRPVFVPPLNTYRVARTAVDELARPWRDAAIPAARTYLEEIGNAKQAEPWLTRPPEGALGALDRLMAAAGVDAVVASTPVNVQGLTGVPSALLGQDTWALYEREAPDVLVLARRETPWLGLPDAPPFDGAALSRLFGGTIGFEDLDLSMEAAEGLKIADRGVPASRLLRRWRELTSWEDLSFYVLGAQVTVRAIEAALGVVREAVRRGDAVSELDAYARYREVVADEISSRNLPIRVRTYFTHTHAGSRSLIPARATDYKMQPLTSLKIDAGLEVYDAGGSLRAASDVTRSALGNQAALDAYELFDRVLVDDVIDACRPGRTGQEVFRAGTNALEPHHSDLAGVGLCPSDGVPFFEAIGRDIGHLLGKQEPATVVFQRGNDDVFEAGMLAAAELQWPYHDHCIGVEDVFMTTDAEPLNLTRGSREG